MKLDGQAAAPTETSLDAIDRQLLSLLQSDCKTSLQELGDAVGLSAPSVVERIRKLEQRGVIKGYHARIDARAVGLDVSAFIGVSMNYPKGIGSVEKQVLALDEVLECHHVTGAHTLLLKVKTRNTSTLEALLSRIRAINGVQRTETMVVLSTRAEKSELPVTQVDGVTSARAQGAKRPTKKRGRSHAA